MEKVQFGTKVNRLGISRVSVAEGSKCRVVLLDPNPRMKHVSYDETIKRVVEVTQDMCIKYRLRPYPTFYYLIAKLNTDLHGNVIGDRFTVEYLQLSENLNNELVDAVEEQGIPASFSLTKVKKVGDGGKDFSYIKVTLSAQDPLRDDPRLAARVNELRNNEEFIESCWAMIDASTTIPVDEYFKLKGMTDEVNKLPDNKQSQKAIDVKPKQADKKLPAPSADESDLSDVNDFQGVDDFAEGFDND